jgi:iron complex outermembrane receptor protein
LIRLALAALLAAVLVPKLASADPSVDVDDLPSLPPAGEEVSNATLVAASSAEEDVVVGADKREQSLGNVASAVTVISGDRIRRFGYRTVSEALAAVAGVYTSDTRIVNGIGIRGLDIPGDFNTRILVLVDGASVNESWGSFAGLGFDSFVSIDDIARIELIRGPVSSVYGTNAFFSIVNIVTRSASETPKAWGRMSINSINGEVASAGFAEGSVSRGVRGTVQAMNRIGETLNLQGVGDHLTGDGAYQLAVSLAGTYDGSFAQIRAFQNERDSPFAPYSGDATAVPPYQLVNTQLLAEVGHTWQVGKQLSVTARIYTNIYQFYDKIIQDPVLVGAPPFDDYGNGQQYGSEIRGRYDVIPQKLGVTAGAEGDYDQTKSHSYTEDGNGNEAPGGTNIPVNLNLEGLYAEVDGQPTQNIGFTAGIRYDRNSAINQNVSPRAALFFQQPEKYGLKLLFAQGFRNPSAYEAFFTDGVSFAPPKNLQAERITSYEAVAWAKPTPGLSLRLSGFYWDATGIIEELADPDPGMQGLLQFQNVGEYVSAGAEFEGSYRNSAGWYAFGGGTYAHVGSTDVTTDGTVGYGTVPNAPAWTGGGGVSTPKLGGLMHLSVEARYIGERAVRTDQDTGAALPDSPGWVGLNGNIYIPNIHGFDVTLGVRNIVGKRDLVVAPGDYDRINENTGVVTHTVSVVPGEGREFFAKLGYSY